jgi:hypothetical protein
MHAKYKNGREAKVNDRVFFRDRQDRLVLGKVTAIERTNEVRVQPIVSPDLMPADRCIHADDHNDGNPKLAPTPAPVTETPKSEQKPAGNAGEQK